MIYKFSFFSGPDLALLWLWKFICYVISLGF
jgi:hypothetical protein